MLWTSVLLLFLTPADVERDVAFKGGANAIAAGPVAFKWPSSWSGPVALVDNTNVLHAVQKYESNGDAFAVCIGPALPSGGTATWKATPDSAAPSQGVELTKTEDGVSVKIDGQPFTTFVTKRVRKPILWPLLGPNGEPLTESGPKDHIHHRSFWFTHGHVNGQDFWSESDRSGKTVLANLRPLVSGPVFGEISCSVDWIAKDGAKVCTDERTMRFYRAPGVRVVDFEIAFRPTDHDLIFGDDKEGTFGVRVAKTMKVEQPKGAPPGGVLVNAEGLRNGAVWGKKSPWCDYSGPVEGGGVAGIAIFDHPRNLRYPTTWHARTYGLFCANPFGLSFFINKNENGEVRVPKGGEFRLRYRVLLHAGDSAAADVPAHFAAYVQPPSVVVE